MSNNINKKKLNQYKIIKLTNTTYFNPAQQKKIKICNNII